ncbi:MAG: M23 family metallopeptidase [Porticoccaceae bacterium]|nr:M23 family metallopeptidase [Porticoccaceae bacterium]
MISIKRTVNRSIDLFHKLASVGVFVAVSFFSASIFAATESAIVWQGSWQQGGLLLGQIKPDYHISVAGEPIKTTADGRFLFGLGRNAQGSSTFLVSGPNGTVVEEHYPVVTRDFKIQRIEGVPQSTVTPPAEQLQRIKSDSALVREARREVTDKTDFIEGFVKPLQGPKTGVYGSQRFYNGVPKSPHYGVDYAAPTGTEVKAPAAGIVRLAHRDLFYSGGTLIIDHGHGLSSSFLHLSDILVTEGSRVERGDAIAKVGATGRATGPHLDWRMNWRNVRVDPELVLQAFPAQ